MSVSLQGQGSVQGTVKIWSTRHAFVAQLRNGKVVAWGDRDYSGDISGVKGDLEQGIENSWSTCFAFLAQLSVLLNFRAAAGRTTGT